MTTRLVAPGDAPELAALLVANRDFLTPWEPFRSEEYFTAEGQRAYLEDMLRQHDAGSHVPHVIVEDDRIVGRITLSGIVRGPFQSASLGYWVAKAANGRGVASAAVAGITRLAFRELGLHRVQAETLVHNVASQKVLERNRFRRYGLAPRYLKINGDWRDHIMFQLLSDDPE
ncbi:GNAT family N-acetyltransferase [Actinoplanes sp. CA-030573]|uniref:GNAT family N-acetyltransferase n=1 Tax=Actinoplanes sp. CA-030573 TaxID=3239898 RepID=UPI003D8D06FD